MARALHDAGARVLAAGTRTVAAGCAAALPSRALRLDLADPAAVDELARRIHQEPGRLDGLVHLVGGWRGGGGIAGQSDADWEFLHAASRTLRNTTRAFYEDLAALRTGRLAIVSATAVDAPTAGTANYAAAKAAAEAWPGPLAARFRAAPVRPEADPEPQRRPPSCSSSRPWWTTHARRSPRATLSRLHRRRGSGRSRRRALRRRRRRPERPGCRCARP